MDKGTAVGRPYADRFRSQATVARYVGLYKPGTRDHHIWSLQQPALTAVVDAAIEGRRAPRLLDFACGTGRVLSLLEEKFEYADGVDIAPEMLEVCRKHVQRARLLAGDIAHDRELPLFDGYDVVTAFRFFLNAPEPVRLSVLGRLRELLEARRGILVFNNHGNRTSLRHLALRMGGRRSELRNELSDHEVCSMLSATGFRMIDRIGIGLLPDIAYRTRAGRLAAAVDAFQARRNVAGRLAIDQLYVATPL